MPAALAFSAMRVPIVSAADLLPPYFNLTFFVVSAGGDQGLAVLIIDDLNVNVLVAAMHRQTRTSLGASCTQGIAHMMLAPESTLGFMNETIHWLTSQYVVYSRPEPGLSSGAAHRLAFLAADDFVFKSNAFTLVRFRAYASRTH